MASELSFPYIRGATKPDTGAARLAPFPSPPLTTVIVYEYKP
jgi:hypothetical protein